MSMSDYLGLGGFLLGCFVIATSGAFFRPGEWYERLGKPSWCPPNWLFAPAWTVLYIMIAISGWLVWRKVGFAGAPVAFALYLLQLLLNAGWSAVFFGMKRIDLAFGELLVFWIVIAANLVAFYAIDGQAGLLLLPYLAWVTFAGALNFAIWRLNAVQTPAASRPFSETRS